MRNILLSLSPFGCVFGAMLVAVFLCLPSSYAATSYTITQGATVEINEHGTCRRVTNTSGGTRYLSTKTSAEWASYVNNPNGLAMASCISYSYGGWSAWGSCSASCGGGSQSRSRSCVRSTDGAAVACSNCGGVCSESQACNTHACATPKVWVRWGTACSGCGPGYSDIIGLCSSVLGAACSHAGEKKKCAGPPAGGGGIVLFVAEIICQ